MLQKLCVHLSKKYNFTILKARRSFKTEEEDTCNGQSGVLCFHLAVKWLLWMIK